MLQELQGIIPTTTAIIIFIIVVIAMILANWMGRLQASDRQEKSYKQGQVDALNGKQNFKLIEFVDGTREYVKESELGNYKVYKIIK